MTQTNPEQWADNANVQRAVMASVNLGAWMSAALDDPKVCDAMKADIREWFSAGEPVSAIQAAFAEREAPLVEALEDVINPLGYLKRHAEAKGSQLNGMAYQIANDPSFAKSIANEALAALKDRTHG